MTPPTSVVFDGYFNQRRAVALEEYRRCLTFIQRHPKRNFVFCLMTALKVLMIDPPRSCSLNPDVLHVLSRSQGGRDRTTSAAQFHYLQSLCSTLTLDFGEGPINLTDPVTTCIQLSGYCTREETTVLFDFLTRRSNVHRMLNERDLETYIEKCGLFRGIQNARWAWHHHRMNTDSSMETRLRLLFANKRMPMPKVNMMFHDRLTGRTYYCDLVYDEVGIVLEYQGVEWHTDLKTSLQRDADKSNALQAAGCVIIPVTARKVLTEAGQAELLAAVRMIRKRRQKTLSGRQKARFAAMFRNDQFR